MDPAAFILLWISIIALGIGIYWLYLVHQENKAPKHNAPTQHNIYMQKHEPASAAHVNQIEKTPSDWQKAQLEELPRNLAKYKYSIEIETREQLIHFYAKRGLKDAFELKQLEDEGFYQGAPTSREYTEFFNIYAEKPAQIESKPLKSQQSTKISSLDPAQMQVSLIIKQLNETQNIVLSSKNPDTIKSRIEGGFLMAQELKNMEMAGMYSGLPSAQDYIDFFKSDLHQSKASEVAENMNLVENPAMPNEKPSATERQADIIREIFKADREKDYILFEKSCIEGIDNFPAFVEELREELYQSRQVERYDFLVPHYTPFEMLLKLYMEQKRYSEYLKICEHAVSLDISEDMKYRFRSREKQIENQRKLDLEIPDLDNVPDGFFFEEYIAKLLNCNGYIASPTKKSGDFGVDIIAEKDGIKYAVQCKLFSKPVGPKAVQEVVAGKIYYDCDAAIVVTNNLFTDSAVRLAEKTKVILWDRQELSNLIKNAQEAFAE